MIKSRYKILLLVFLIGMLNQVKSQNWCPTGATWHYKIGFLGSFTGVDGLLTYKYESDTIIQNLSCKKIKGVFTGFWSNYQYGTSHFYRNYYSRESNKVLYLYNSGKFDTIVNYNASIGDRWIKSVAASCNKRLVVLVIDTGHAVINGISLKGVKISYNDSVLIGNPPHYKKYISSYWLYEKINYQSYNNESLDIFDNLCEPNLAGNNDNAYITFRCYEDNYFPNYSIASTSCNDITGIVKENDMNNSFNIFPNPSSGKIVFTTSFPFTIKLFDSQGDLIFEKNLNVGNQQVNLSSIPKGLYFCVASYQNLSITKKLIIE